MTNAYHPERGAAAFYIILGIILLAGLSYAVSQNFRFSSASLSKDQARMGAQEIIEYGNTIANAVQKLRLRGFSDTQIDFGTPVYQFNNGSSMAPSNPNCTSNACRVFSPEGGNVNPVIFSDYAVHPDNPNPAWGKPGHVIFRNISVAGVGTNANELTMQVFLVKPEVCYQIGLIEGALESGDIPSETYNNANAFAGTYDSPFADPLGDLAGTHGKTSLCPRDGDGSDHYTRVLIAR